MIFMQCPQGKFVFRPICFSRLFIPQAGGVFTYNPERAQKGLADGSAHEPDRQGGVHHVKERTGPGPDPELVAQLGIRGDQVRA
jgi:hypothetical protein